MWFHLSRITRADLSTISQAGRLGNPKKQSQGMAYLLLVPSQEAEEEKRFGLAGVWVHPNQFLLSSLKEAAKKLTLLISTKEDWYYTLVMSQWGCTAPPPFQCQTHQHLSRWSTQQKLLWASQPTGGLSTSSLGQCGDIPKGPEWRSRTSVGHSAKATTLGDGVHQWGHSIADNSSQNHPGRLPGSSPSTVIDTGFLPTLHYRVPQQGSHWSQSDRGDYRPLIEPHVWNARGILHSQFPPFNGQEGGNLPDPGEALQGYLKQPPPSPHGSSQVDMANITAPSSCSPSPSSPERGTSPTPLAITGPLHQPIGGCIAPSGGDDVMVHLLSARATMDMHATNGSYQKQKLVITKMKFTLLRLSEK